jgi:hypothetical protein
VKLPSILAMVGGALRRDERPLEQPVRLVHHRLGVRK